MSKTQDALFAELRHLLLQDEWQEHKEKLNQLIRDLDDTGKRVDELAGILPKAIVRNIEQDAKQLEQSLLPVTQQQIKILVQKDRKWFANLLTPIMMPMIRSSISTAIEDVLNRINNLFAGQTSLFNIIKWRIQSLFTGASYAELVLKDTVDYRVDQVYLLHDETGLLIDHVTNQSVKVDPDGVSAMLVALEDFMQDSFSDDGKRLNSVKIGEQIAWLFYRDKIALACLIQGMPENELYNNIQNEFDALYENNFDLIQEFDTDREPLKATVRPYLDKILSFEKFKTKPVSSIPGYIALGLLSVFLLGYFGYRFWSHNQLENFVEQVESQQGWQELDYEITGPGVINWKSQLSAHFLVDPFAEDYQQALHQLPVHLQDNISIKRVAQMSFAPDYIQQLVENLGVEVLSNEGNNFVLKADTEDSLQKATSFLSFLNMTSEGSVSHSNLRIPLTVYFTVNEKIAADSLEKLEQWLTMLADTLCKVPSRCSFVITPHNDFTGTEEANEVVRLLRFGAVKSLIHEQFKDVGILYNTDFSEIHSYETHSDEFIQELRNVEIQLVINDK